MNLRPLLVGCILLGCSGATAGNTADAAFTDDATSVTDGNAVPDAFSSDVPGDAHVNQDRADGFDPPQTPRCGPPYQASVGTNHSTLLYPPTTIAVFGGSTITETSYDTEARWLGTRVLTQPFLAQCGPGEMAHPCTLDRLLRLQLPDMQVIELLLSIDYDALDAPAPNAPISLLLRINRGSYNLSDIIILDAQDRVVLAAFSNRTQREDSWQVGGIQLSVSPTTAPPTCISFPQPMCERVFGAYPLNVAPHGAETFAPQDVPAAASAVVSTLQGRYRVAHRKTLRQIQGLCSSPPISESQFEVIRLRD